MTKNLVSVIDALSEFEKQFIIRRLNALDATMNCHLGILPFVNLELVVRALHFLPASSQNPDADLRKGKAILEKFESSGNVLFRMNLNDTKVFSRSRGEGTSKRLLTLRMTKKVRAGIQWFQFKEGGAGFEKVEVMVRNQILVTRIKPGLWEIEAPKNLVNAAREELFTLCSDGFDEYRKLRVKKNQFSGGEFIQKPRTGKELQRPRVKVSTKGFDGRNAKPLVTGARNIKIMGKRVKRKKQ